MDAAGLEPASIECPPGALLDVEAILAPFERAITALSERIVICQQHTLLDLTSANG